MFETILARVGGQVEVGLEHMKNDVSVCNMLRCPRLPSSSSFSSSLSLLFSKSSLVG